MDRKECKKGAKSRFSASSSCRSKRKRNRNNKRASPNSDRPNGAQNNQNKNSRDSGNTQGPTDYSAPSNGSNGSAIMVRNGTETQNGTNSAVQNNIRSQTGNTCCRCHYCASRDDSSSPELSSATNSRDDLTNFQNLSLQNGETSPEANDDSDLTPQNSPTTGLSPHNADLNRSYPQPQPTQSTTSPSHSTKSEKSPLQPTRSEEGPHRRNNPQGARPKTFPQAISKLSSSAASVSKSYPPVGLPANVSQEEAERLIRKMIPLSTLKRASKEWPLALATGRLDPDRLQSAASRINQQCRQEYENRRNRLVKRASNKIGKAYQALEEQLPPQFAPKERSKSSIIQQTLKLTKMLENQLAAAPATSMCLNCNKPRIACGCEVPDYLRQPMERITQRGAQRDDFLAEEFDEDEAGNRIRFRVFEADVTDEEEEGGEDGEKKEDVVTTDTKDKKNGDNNNHGNRGKGRKRRGRK